MNTITVNGKTYVGRSINISQWRVVIDGVDATDDAKNISIIVNGNLDILHCDACNTISVTWDAGKVDTMSGDVDIKWQVSGSVKTMSGDVTCWTVGGSVTTMSWDINHN